MSIISYQASHEQFKPSELLQWAILAEKAGFTVEKVIYDSEAFQFFASEQYARDIPMNDERAFRGNVAESIFTAGQLAAWQREAENLNAQNRGDQACFYLKKKRSG